ncbi:MAG TPA: DHA2 family efflux MFS transporter permease subunit [Stellaceae bacterium]|nr:DHA2 family efflux MFS transporter permease subunit [Stellaceae bacterium]
MPYASTNTPSPGETLSPGRIRLIAMIIGSALFMEMLDVTILSTALPTMAQDLAVKPLHMSLALTSYLLSLAIFIPVSAILADRFGTRMVFRAAILLFTLGSVLCGQAHSLAFLVFARLLQGLGGALMMPVGRLILVRCAPKSEYVRALSWVVVPGFVGPIVGPAVGGIIVTYLSWRWIFFVNVPIGLLGLVLATIYIPEVREAIRTRFDPLGFVLSGISLACMVFGLEALSRGAGDPAYTLGLLGVGAVFWGLYLIHAQRHPAPILDLKLMRVTTFNVSVIAGALTRISGGGIPFMLPLMMQLGFGYSPMASGFILLSGATGSIVMKAVATGIIRRWGFRDVMIWNCVIASLSIAICAAFRPDWPLALIFAVLLVSGFFQALQFTAYNTVAYADLAPEQMGAATSFYSTFQQLMLSIGICAAVGVLYLSSVVLGHDKLMLDDFSVGFLVMALASAAAIPFCARLAPDAGADMSGHVRGGAKAEVGK